MKYLVKSAGPELIANQKGTGGLFEKHEEAWDTKIMLEEVTGHPWEVWLVEFHTMCESRGHNGVS